MRLVDEARGRRRRRSPPYDASGKRPSPVRDVAAGGHVRGHDDGGCSDDGVGTAAGGDSQLAPQGGRQDASGVGTLGAQGLPPADEAGDRALGLPFGEAAGDQVAPVQPWGSGAVVHDEGRVVDDAALRMCILQVDAQLGTPM